MESLGQSGTAMRGSTTERVEAFRYPTGPFEAELPEWVGWAAATPTELGAVGETCHDSAGGTAKAVALAEFDRQLTEETRKAFEAGKERGRQEGQQTEREAQARGQVAADQRRMRQAAGLVESFALERDRYLREVEHEVVELSLAVAARILRREAQMDPLLLTGAVRVALGQLAGSTQVRLLVPQGELDLWAEAIGLVPNLTLKPMVLAGEGMRLGDCRIETEMGSVDLGIRAQLGEIERGFFDRAGSRKEQPALALQCPLKAGGEAR